MSRTKILNDRKVASPEIKISSSEIKFTNDPS
jgi:hypothetical protein